EPLQGRGDAWRVCKRDPGVRFLWQPQAAPFHVLIHDIEEGYEGEVAAGKTFGKARRNLDHAVMCRLDMPEQDHAVGGEVAEIDGRSMNHGMPVQEIGNEVALIGTGGDDDIAGLDRAISGLGNEAGRAVALREPLHLDAAADRWRNELGIVLDEFDDLAGG